MRKNDDVISRQAAIETIGILLEQSEDDEHDKTWNNAIRSSINAVKHHLPSAQPDVPDINVGDINKFIDGLEEIFADIRERHVDDSVCGLCEYDGAYLGQSGDWCNECPGFEKDDCFKLSGKCRKEWINAIAKAQPEPLTEIDAVKREDVVDILHRIMQGRSDSEEDLIGEIVSEVDLLPSAQPYTEDEIQKIQDLEQAQLDKAFELGKQTAQAEIIHCRECKHHIDGFFCQKANHHTSDTECCASVFGAERMEE